MSDVMFMNAYNEIVFENFLAVLKQNLMFQTQLKIMETKVAKVDTLERELAECRRLSHDSDELQTTITRLTQEVNAKTSQLQQSSTAEAERHRIQTALNEKMGECETLKATVNMLTHNINQLTQQVTSEQSLRDDHTKLTHAVAELNTQLREQTTYISTLETLVPASKRKKIGLPVTPEMPINTVNTILSDF